MATELISSIDPIAQTARLLQGIQWAGDVPQEWIGRIRQAIFTMEIDLADFGSPDLILVCDTPERRHVCLVEAKTIPYLMSATSNRGGMTPSGFNSAINGQISLQHRFAHALSHSGEETSDISEPPKLHRYYSRSDGQGLRDPRLRPRHLAKRSVLQIPQQRGLLGLSADQFHFVAFTDDQRPFWEVAGKDLLPLFLDVEDGTDAWAAVRHRVGWIGYRTVARQLELGSCYQAAVHTMGMRICDAAAEATPLEPEMWTQISADLLEDLSRSGHPHGLGRGGLVRVNSGVVGDWRYLSIGDKQLVLTRYVPDFQTVAYDRTSAKIRFRQSW